MSLAQIRILFWISIALLTVGLSAFLTVAAPGGIVFGAFIATFGGMALFIFIYVRMINKLEDHLHPTEGRL